MRAQNDTPPSSIAGDDINGMDQDENDDGVYFLEEVNLDDLESHLGHHGSGSSEEDMIEDHATLVFRTHVGSIFACNIHPEGKLAVTGGEDDRAHVWNIQTGQMVTEYFDHKDSVVFCAFSHDGAYLATADMSGFVRVFKCMPDDNQQQLWPVVFEYDSDDLTWGQWHFGARVLMFGTMSGEVYVYKVPSGETKVLEGHSFKTEAGKLFHDGVRLAVGYGDGSVKIWDLRTSTVLHTVAPTFHAMRITDIDLHPQDSVMASISPDGKLVLTTPNNGRVVGQIEAGNDLETVAFAPDPQLGLLALGTLRGGVTIWDVSRQMMRHECAKAGNRTSGITKMFWIQNQLVTGCLDGAIRVYDGRNGQCTQTITGHRSEILDLYFLPKDNIMLSASDDNTARIYKYVERQAEN